MVRVIKQESADKIKKLTSQNEEMTAKFEQLAHRIAEEIIAANYASQVSEETTIKEIVARTGVSEETARTFIEKCSDVKN